MGFAHSHASLTHIASPRNATHCFIGGWQRQLPKNVKRKKPNILEDYFAKIISCSTPSLAWGLYCFFSFLYI
jgi:hypothetical protein